MGGMTAARKKVWTAIVGFGFLCATYTLIDTAAKAFQRDVWHPLTTGASKECNP
jgi:hypothetical protein